MKTRVLLVDDDPGVAAAVGDMLSSEGYEVVYARNGREAVDDFPTHGQIGLVLLDLCMPEMGGWDTFERLTAIDPLLPIIVITARPDQKQLAEAAGVGALMEKPLNIPRLLEIMRTLLAESPEERLARIAGQSPGALHFQSKNRRKLKNPKS